MGRSGWHMFGRMRTGPLMVVKERERERRRRRRRLRFNDMWSLLFLWFTVLTGNEATKHSSTHESFFFLSFLSVFSFFSLFLFSLHGEGARWGCGMRIRGSNRGRNRGRDRLLSIILSLHFRYIDSLFSVAMDGIRIPHRQQQYSYSIRSSRSTMHANTYEAQSQRHLY